MLNILSIFMFQSAQQHIGRIWTGFRKQAKVVGISERGVCRTKRRFIPKRATAI
jgi:transposase-like protein